VHWFHAENFILSFTFSLLLTYCINLWCSLDLLSLSLFQRFVRLGFDVVVRSWVPCACRRQRFGVALVGTARCCCCCRGRARNPRALRCCLSLLPRFPPFSSLPASRDFPHTTIQNMSVVKMQWDTIPNTSLQLRCIIFLFIFQRCNAVRRVNQVSLERFLSFKLLFIACHYTACLILEVYFFPITIFSKWSISCWKKYLTVLPKGLLLKVVAPKEFKFSSEKLLKNPQENQTLAH